MYKWDIEIGNVDGNIVIGIAPRWIGSFFSKAVDSYGYMMSGAIYTFGSYEDRNYRSVDTYSSGDVVAIVVDSA